MEAAAAMEAAATAAVESEAVEKEAAAAMAAAEDSRGRSRSLAEEAETTDPAAMAEEAAANRS